MWAPKVYLVPGVTAAAAAAGLLAAPQAAAECTSSGGVTICAQGNVTGASGVPSSSGPYYPYPCEDDWLCDDGGVSLVIDPGPPGGIDIGRPGRPGFGPR
jgi:hypothetical protein